MNRVIGPDGAVRTGFELLHPGPGLGFVGPHRRIPGGVLTAEGDILLLPTLLSACWTDEGLLLAWRSGGRRVQLGRWRDGRLALLRELHASGVRLGGRWLSRWLGAACRVETVEEGAPVRLPLGLRRARCAPDAPAVLHAAGKALVRVDARGRVRVVGVVDGGVRGLLLGPRGSAVGWTETTAFSLSGTGGPRALPLSGPFLGASFSADGAEAMVEDEDGVALVDLASGDLLDFRPDVRVAGWPLLADLCGDLHEWADEGLVPAQGLPGPGVVLDGRLHGPGGRAWALDSAEPVGPALTAGADLACALGDALVVVDDDALLLRDPQGAERQLARLADDDTALELSAGEGQGGAFVALRTLRGAWWGGRRPSSWRHLDLRPPSAGPLLRPLRDGGILLPTDEGALLLTGLSAPRPLPSDGTRPAAPVDACVAPPAGLHGLPIDGCLRAGDGATWVWQDDGVLIRLSPS